MGVEVGALYRPGMWPLEQKGQSITLDLLAGARYWWLSADLDTSTVINPSRSTEWGDPFMGLRGTTDITKQLTFTLRGDVGGFGVGSDFSWNGSGLFGYRFTDFGPGDTPGFCRGGVCSCNDGPPMAY